MLYYVTIIQVVVENTKRDVQSIVDFSARFEARAKIFIGELVAIHTELSVEVLIADGLF